MRLSNRARNTWSFLDLGVRSYRVEFLEETADKVREVLALYSDALPDDQRHGGLAQAESDQPAWCDARTVGEIIGIVEERPAIGSLFSLGGAKFLHYSFIFDKIKRILGRRERIVATIR